jgi:RHS repeat-associated protein
VDKNNVDVTANPPVKTAYSFTNREWDQDAGMYYYRARYYDPGIGRFIQEDSHPGKVSLPRSVMNKYIYVANNPTRYVDPSGKIIGAILIGALVSGSISAALTGGSMVDAFISGFTNGLIMGTAIAAGALTFGGIATALGASGGMATLIAGIGGAALSNAAAYSLGARGNALFVATLFGFIGGVGIGGAHFGKFSGGKVTSNTQAGIKGTGEGISSEGMKKPIEGDVGLGATEVIQEGGTSTGIEHPKDLCYYNFITKTWSCISF